MNELESRVSAILQDYISDLLADCVRRRAQQSLGIREGSLSAQDLPVVRTAIAVGVKLFVEEKAQVEVHERLQALIDESRPADHAEMAVDTELDVSRVRRRAWDLARALGASSFAAQRVATAASELARNIVIHAGHGRVELRAIGSGGRRGMTVRAIDSGRGIENLERILAGNYRSKTGLGKGLLGVKRMSRRFDVQTSPTGTTVEADVALGLDPH